MRSAPLMPPRQRYYRYVEARGSDGLPVTRAIPVEENCPPPCSNNPAQPFPPVIGPDPLSLYRTDTRFAMSQEQYRIISAGEDCFACVPNVPVPFPPVIAPDVRILPTSYITRQEVEERFALKPPRPPYDYTHASGADHAK